MVKVQLCYLWLWNKSEMFSFFAVLSVSLFQSPHTMEATFERLDMVIYSVSPLQFLSLKENLIATSEGAYSN